MKTSIYDALDSECTSSYSTLPLGTTTMRQSQNTDYLSSSNNKRTQNNRSQGKDARDLHFHTFDEVRTRGKSATWKDHLRDSLRAREQSLLPRSRSQASKTYQSQENRVRTTGLQAATKKQESVQRKSMKASRKVLTEKNGLTYGSNQYATNEDSRKTVTKIYSSRKERGNKKTGKLRSDRNDSRLPNSNHLKTYAIIAVSSNTVEEGSVPDKEKNERENRENKVPQSTSTVKPTMTRRVSDNSKIDNCRRKPSLEDSRSMPSLIQSDTETDTVSYDQIPSSNDKTAMGTAVSEKMDANEEESENWMEKKFYDGIYFLGDQANNILSYAFSKENRVEPEATSQVNGEPSRSEF